MWGKIQRNYLPILSAVIFVFIVAVLLIEIDRQIYQDKKKDICIANFEKICPRPLIKDLMGDYVKDPRVPGGWRFERGLTEEYFNLVDRMRNVLGERPSLEPRAQAFLRKINAETSRILNSHNALVSIEIATVQYRDDEKIRDVVVRHEVDKYGRLNTTTNSLILQRFWGKTTMPFSSRWSPTDRVGEVVFQYSTPFGIEEIEALTARFRWYMAGVVLVLTLLYWYILRHLIMPIKVVTGSIDRSKGVLPEILPNPRTVLEAAYNDLARDSLLSAVTRTMAEYMSVDRLVSRDEIIGSMPDLLTPNFGFDAVYAVELIVGEGSENPVRWVRSAFRDPKNTRFARPTDTDWAEIGRRWDLDWSQTIVDFTVTNDRKSRPYFAVPLAFDRDERQATFLVATPRGSLTQENLRWSRETLVRLADAMRSGLETLDLQRNLIAREQSKANISLSRNLGHDLTNVIATSKLELDTVRRFLRLPPERQEDLDPQTKTLFAESLQGLLNNTKFLQEVINIYRSFSYMHHPEYEWTDLNALVNEVVEPFQMSLSRRMRIHRSYGSDVPHSYVEPRLLKLAIFNLMTNATDALKRRAMHEGDFGAELWTATTYDREADTIAISVRDNGLGIYNRQGEPASPDEIRAIFRAGFTTKREGMAEGLGLNWVRQIIYDFHRGQIEARNHPEGGAEVSLVLPRLETEPDLGGYGRPSDEAKPAREEKQPEVAEINK